MGYISPQGEQSTLAEIQMVTALHNLDTTPSGYALVKTAAGTFGNTVIGMGTVTSVTVVTSQGVSGTVSTATTTPSITLALGALTGVTSLNGLVVTANTGIITTGTWNASLITGTYGGTGVNNGTKTFTYLKNISITAADDTGVYTLPTGTKTLLATDGAGTSLTGIPYTLTGTANQVVLSAGTGNITFSLPQSIATSSAVSFASVATSAASPLLLTNGQLVTVALTSQTVGGTTLTIPNFASVVDTFVFITLAQVLSNKTFVAPALGTVASGNISACTSTSMVMVTPVLGTPTSGTLTNCTGLPVAGITASTSTAIGVGSVELGHASDTTLSRSAAGILAVEGVVVPSISSTNTLTNKRVTKRVTSTAGPGATPTINTDNADVVHLTAIAAAITSMTTNLSGTPVEGDTLRIDFTDDGTARAITWGTSFEASTIALPTTTVISTRLDVGFFWNTVTSKWRCVASA